MPRGVDLNKIASISRDKLTKTASLHIDTSSKWEIFAGDHVDSIDMSHPILTGDGGGDFVLPVDLNKRSYFRLRIGMCDAVMAERVLPMEGAFNIRDLGGIKLKDDRRVKWGKLFRADELTNLTDADVEYLGSISIASVIDFRAEVEIKRAPDRLPKTARYTYPLAITPGAMRTDGAQSRGIASFSNQMKQMNRLYVSDSACVRAYRIMFTIIQNNLSAPLIFHCSAGKDRTGMAAALILFALGATEETVLQDYMISKAHIGSKYTAMVEKYPRTAPIFTVKRNYLEAGIEQMKLDYGSIENFLTKELKVDIPRLRRIYLEPRG